MMYNDAEPRRREVKRGEVGVWPVPSKASVADCFLEAHAFTSFHNTLPPKNTNYSAHLLLKSSLMSKNAPYGLDQDW